MFPLRCEISLEVSVFCGLEVLEERLNSLERSDANLVQVLVPVVVQLKNELLDERVQLIFVFELFDDVTPKTAGMYNETLIKATAAI